MSAGSDFLVSDPPHSPQAVVESFLGDDDDAWREDDADEEYNSVFMSGTKFSRPDSDRDDDGDNDVVVLVGPGPVVDCLLYTSPSPRDQRGSRMPSSA